MLEGTPKYQGNTSSPKKQNKFPGSDTNKVLGKEFYVIASLMLTKLQREQRPTTRGDQENYMNTSSLEADTLFYLFILN